MILDMTIEEIKDLAEYSGLVIDDTRLPDEDEMDAVICITHGHPDGMENEEGVIEHYKLVMYFEDCPEEGVIPLGKPQ